LDAGALHSINKRYAFFESVPCREDAAARCDRYAAQHPAIVVGRVSRPEKLDGRLSQAVDHAIASAFATPKISGVVVKV
jgi:hypothetical protein